MTTTFLGKGHVYLGTPEPKEKPMLDIFISENPGQTWGYTVCSDTGLGASAEHEGFDNERLAIDHAVKTYKAKHLVAVIVTVELENPHMDLQQLTDMISGRAATIQGVNAMKANGLLHEHWFEAEDARPQD